MSSDVYPLGVANLAAYADAYVFSPDPLQFTIVREPQDLKRILDDEPPDDEAPASGGGFVPPVTVIVRVVFATPSFAVPAPLADIAATQSVRVPFVCGAVNENL